MITLADLNPIAFCLATDDLFDFKNFQASFCDYLILRERNRELENFLIPMKRELNSSVSQRKYLEGYKIVIIRNLDKIISLVNSRYRSLDARKVERIARDTRGLIKKVILAEDFLKVTELEPEFRTKILLPVYGLFTNLLKRQ